MRIFGRVRYETEALNVSTRGLAKFNEAEITIRVNSLNLLNEAENFLRFVVNYLETVDTKITPRQTMNYGCWLVKFEPTESGVLDVWEYDSEFRHFQHGVLWHSNTGETN